MASPTASCPKLKVTFKKWTAVAVWKWLTPNDETECGICRLPFEGCCPDCKFPGDDCALGGCGFSPVPSLSGIKTRQFTLAAKWVLKFMSHLPSLSLQCRDNAGTASTYTASRSGWRLSRCSNNVPCVDKTGSSANNHTHFNVTSHLKITLPMYMCITHPPENGTLMQILLYAIDHRDY